MKKTIKKIFSLIIVFCMACVGLISTPIVGAKAEESGTWNLVTDASDLAVGDKVVVVAKDSNYALSTEQKTNNRGQAEVTKDGNTITFGADVQQITLEAGTKAGTLAFNVGTGYLYAANSGSNQLKTQTKNNDNGSWEITIAEDGVEAGTATIVAQGTNTRNVMQYNKSSSLFACYGSASQQAICLYKFVAQEEIVLPEAIKDLNAVDAYMSLSYKYKETTQEEVIPDKKVVCEFGANGSASHSDGSSETEYMEKVGDYTLELTDGTSMYTGARDAKGNSCIKLGTSSKTGGFSFTVPDDVTSVIIAVAKYKANTSKITVNGTAYTLTKNSNDGAYDEITVDTSTTKGVSVTTVSGGYRAMVNSITFVVPTNEGGTEMVTTLSDSEFRFRCGVDATLLDLKDVVDAYGIRVTTNDKTANYTDTATSWATDAENGMVYVIIGLGDIIDDIDKLTTEFTVQAYVVYDEVTYLSASTKTYSVASIIKMYYEEKNIVDVEHLYNYLQENNQEVA